MIKRKPTKTPGGIISVGILALLATDLHADTLILKNGQTVSGDSFLRKEDALIADSSTSVPLSEIASVECEQPPVLKNAATLLATGRTSSLLSQLRVAVPLAEIYGELPGSCWPDLYSLEAHVLLASGQDAEAAKLASATKRSKNPGLAADSQALRALISARMGDHSAATYLAEPVLREAVRPSAVAAASLALGLGHLEKKEFPEALKAFLELPVFLPDEVALLGIARLGSARAYFGMADYDRAIATLEELIKARPGSPEVSTAESLLPEWIRRRSAVLAASEH